MKNLLVFIFALHLGNSYAKNYVIYSITQDIPMGEANEIPKKNFYVNMGKNQGVHEGSTIDVYRLISRDNSFETEKTTFFRVKIGELKIVHSEDENAIAVLGKFLVESPMHFEINGLMIGDAVGFKTKN